MNHRLGLCVLGAFLLVSSQAHARGSFIQDVSTTTASAHYLVSADGSDGSIGVGYRAGFMGIIGLCLLADLDYRFDRSALDVRLGFDLWIAFLGLRPDLIVRHDVADHDTRVGAALGAQMMLSTTTIFYAGANMFPEAPPEGVFGLTWMFDGL